MVARGRQSPTEVAAIRYRLGSPECETNSDTDDSFRVVAGSRGGWKSDWGATVVEVACLLWLVVCMGILPVARWAARAAFTDPSRTTVANTGIRAFVDNQSLRTSSNFFVASIGTVLLALAFATSGSVFGYAWLKATMQEEVGWTASVTSGYVYTHGLDSLFVMVACGMALAAIQNRWTITAYGTCDSVCVPTLVWILMAFLPVGLVLTVVGLETFVDKHETTSECEIFDGGFDRASCFLKWVLLLAGSALIVFVLVVMAGSFLLRRVSHSKSEQVGRAYPPDKQTTSDYEPLPLAFRLPIRFE